MDCVLSLSRVTLVKNGKMILDDIDFEVKKGEHWAVVGPNGAGKSFLLRLIAALHFPTSGTIEVLGKRFGEYDLWKLKTHIGFASDLLQKNYHPGDQGLNIVLSGFFSSIGLYDEATEAMRKKAGEIIAFLGLDGLHARRFDEMSHGEQRKILLARALVLDPALLVLDEPCTGLDIAAREDFLAALSKLANTDRSIILVTHHLEEIIPEIGSVLFLKRGRVVAQGVKNNLITETGLSELFDHPVTVRQKSGRFFTSVG